MSHLLYNDIEFWLSERKVILGDSIGWSCCDEWVVNMLASLQIKCPHHDFSVAEVKIPINHPEYKKIGCHYWLESKVNNELFIADGTAGQIDRQFKTGFFDFYGNARKKLKAVYDLPRIKE